MIFALMRFLHLADLHLGKRLKEFSLIEDQRFVLNQAVQLIQDEAMDGVFLAGDIYDSSVPSAEAMSLFDDFLTALNQAGVPVFIISGNHDSADKLQFGGRIFKKNKIYVCTDVKDALTPIVLGDVCIYLLPFIRPIDVNDAFQSECGNYSEAIQEVLKRMAPDPKKTNILLAHQMVLPLSGSLLAGGSESVSSISDGVIYGDVTSVSASLFQDFDYVALGHVHRPQNIAKNARYPGSILKYHKDEATLEKSFTVVDIEGKTISLSIRPERYLHDVIHLQGTLAEILSMKADENAYVFATLTDPSTLEDPMGKLRRRFPLAAAIEYVARGDGASLTNLPSIEKESKEDLFASFYQSQNGQELNEKQQQTIHRLLGKEGQEP
jgi:DNA repair protein SbcD/Mre11